MASLMLFSMGVVSCIEEGKDQIAGKGTNEFRFETEEFGVVTFLPFTADQTKALVTIYRDAVSTGAMDKEVSVTLEINTDSLAAYNSNTFDEHDPVTGDVTIPHPELYYVLLDPATYTLNIAPGTVTFAPNEGAKTIEITLNTIPLDLGAAHVLPFVIKSATDSYELNEGHNLTIIQALPINKYDGIYEVTGDPWTDQVNGNFSAWYPFDWHAETTGADEIWWWDPYFENYYHPMNNVGAQSAYGAFGVAMEFDPATGDIVNMYSPWAPAANTRNLLWDPNVGPNQWNESDGSIDATYHMIQPSLVPTPPHIRSSFINEHMTYVEPR